MDFELELLEAGEVTQVKARCQSQEVAISISGSRIESLRDQDPNTVGRDLYNTFFTSDVGKLFQMCAPRTLFIKTYAPHTLQSLPWELLHNGDGFLALDRKIAIIRFPVKQQRTRGLGLSSPPRMRITLSNPPRLHILFTTGAAQRRSLALEEEAILDAITRRLRPLMDLSVERQVTPDRLIHRFQQAAKGSQPFQLWHHSGDVDLELNALGLQLNGSSAVLSANDFHQLLNINPELRMVVLNAQPGDQAAFLTALAHIEAPVVIGIQRAGWDLGMLGFLEHFYEQLLYSVDAALTLTRVELHRQHQYSLDWASPVMFTSTHDLRLFPAVEAGTKPQVKKMEPSIFLSYSRHDEAIMRRIHNDLSSRGLEVWIDTSQIQPGTPSWKRAIEEAIKKSSCVVCILSPDAAQSKWVRAELDFAEVLGKRVFLLLTRGEETNAVPFGYTSSQWIDIRQESQYAMGLQKLVTALNDYLQNTGVPLKVTLHTSDLTPPPLRCRILFLASNPVDTDRIRVDKEAREIRDWLERATHREHFELINHGAVRYSDFQTLMLKTKPQILHFSGHGSVFGLLVEREDGEVHTMPIEPVARLVGRFRKHSLQVVVLNACWSEAQAEAIVKQGIDCVIGMTQAIGDAAAIEFARSLYGALAECESVQSAFEMACDAIGIASLVGDMNTPQIKTRTDLDANQLVLC